MHSWTKYQHQDCCRCKSDPSAKKNQGWKFQDNLYYSRCITFSVCSLPGKNRHKPIPTFQAGWYHWPLLMQNQRMIGIFCLGESIRFLRFCQVFFCFLRFFSALLLRLFLVVCSWKLQSSTFGRENTHELPLGHTVSKYPLESNQWKYQTLITPKPLDKAHLSMSEK